VIIENNGLADTVHNPQVEVKTIRWEGRIFEELHLFDQVLHFQISPFSFFQTNTTGAEVLFSAALEMVGRVKGTVLDLYCGSGTIGICALRSWRWSRLVGIEIVEEAIVMQEKTPKSTVSQISLTFLREKQNISFVINQNSKNCSRSSNWLL
jgi:tRNA/tmRNA/rRNA uracil-C5-methylase (TrmA/RlmC/RlmD family)